jgi:hypothetical protein
MTDISYPERSVTRFFIPLIDVLLLLFCIYLLLPIARSPADQSSGNDLISTTVGSLSPSERLELERLKRAVAGMRPEEKLTAAERSEVERLRSERVATLQERLSVHVLEMDADTGKLYDRGPGHTEIGTEAAALELIDRHRKQAAGRDLYYLILFPSRLTGFPEERQIQAYDRWFKNVAHAFENPLSGF